MVGENKKAVRGLNIFISPRLNIKGQAAGGIRLTFFDESTSFVCGP